MTLARAAAADRTGALTPEQIDGPCAASRNGMAWNFGHGHGLEQRRVIDALGTAGRFAVAVGVAGAGKTTLLRPLVDAWTAPDDARSRGRCTAPRWRGGNPISLVDAGIPRQNTMAIAALLARAGLGRWRWTGPASWWSTN